MIGAGVPHPSGGCGAGGAEVPLPSYKRRYKRRSPAPHGIAQPHERKWFIMRPRTSSTQQDNLNENKVKILEEEAVCRSCFTIFKEENVLWMKCQCKITLLHDACKLKWYEENGNYNCDVCGEETEIIPMKLVSLTDSATPHERKPKERNTFSCFKRIWLCSS